MGLESPSPSPEELDVAHADAAREYVDRALTQYGEAVDSGNAQMADEVRDQADLTIAQMPDAKQYAEERAEALTADADRQRREKRTESIQKWARLILDNFPKRIYAFTYEQQEKPPAVDTYSRKEKDLPGRKEFELGLFEAYLEDMLPTELGRRRENGQAELSGEEIFTLLEPIAMQTLHGLSLSYGQYTYEGNDAFWKNARNQDPNWYGPRLGNFLNLESTGAGTSDALYFALGTDTRARPDVAAKTYPRSVAYMLGFVDGGENCYLVVRREGSKRNFNKLAQDLQLQALREDNPEAERAYQKGLREGQAADLRIAGAESASQQPTGDNR